MTDFTTDQQKTSLGQLRVACIQIDSKKGEVQRNVETVKRLTKGLQKGSIDLIILPEMALTGYIFESSQEISPFLERPDKGEGGSPSLDLAVELANRLECYVCIGFPCDGETFSKSERKKNVYQIPDPFDARPKEFCPTDQFPQRLAFNSSLLIDRNGEILHIFRKHFNYANDKVWAREGPGFECIKNLPLLGNVCVAICMDINPYDFQAPFNAFELTRFCRKEEVDTLLMNIAWLKSEVEGGDDDDDSQQSTLSKSSLQHINYLAHRLLPLFEEEEDDDVEKESLPPRKPIKIIFCNRTGTEEGAQFAGTSFALQIQYPSKPKVNGYMDQNEGMAIFTI